MFPQLQDYIAKAEKNFENIPAERKALLESVAEYIGDNHTDPLNLTYICTHNSRRSHLSQLWAQVGAAHYGVSNIHTFSGGTETTAFNPRAVAAVERAGFKVNKSTEGDNPVYDVNFSDETPAVKAFSKVYQDPFNPQEDFVAIMTCDSADANCPVVFGAKKRFSTTFRDPKESDGTPQEQQIYDERCFQIATETLYYFSKVKNS